MTFSSWLSDRLYQQMILRASASSSFLLSLSRMKKPSASDPLVRKALTHVGNVPKSIESMGSSMTTRQWPCLPTRVEVLSAIVGLRDPRLGARAPSLLSRRQIVYPPPERLHPSGFLILAIPELREVVSRALFPLTRPSEVRQLGHEEPTRPTGFATPPHHGFRSAIHSHLVSGGVIGSMPADLAGTGDGLVTVYAGSAGWGLMRQSSEARAAAPYRSRCAGGRRSGHMPTESGSRTVQQF